MANYRPITILPVFAKLFEKLVHQQITSFLVKNDIISNKQHGFRKDKSCETALYRLWGLPLRSAEARRLKKDVIVVSLDFKHAFNLLNVEYLIRAFGSHHFGSAAVTWLTSYLTDRSQLTKYANVLSNLLPVTTEVPEDSLLSSTLFNLHINSSLHSLPAESVIAYADVVTSVCSHKNLRVRWEEMQALLELVCKWADSARLVLNVSKCAAMYIPYAKAKALEITPLPLFINGLRIPTVAEMKILSILFQSSLNWLKQATLVRTKISHMSGVLQRFGCTLDMLTRQRIFNAFTMLQVLFCLLVWDNLSNANCRLFDNSLLKCVKLILHNTKAVLNKDTFESVDVQPFKQHVFIRNVFNDFNVLKENECALPAYWMFF